MLDLNEVVIAGIFTVIGAALGFLGAIVQGIIAAKNSKNIIALETQKEIDIKKYFEKEKLYADIIGFLPQLYLSVDMDAGKVNLSRDDKIMLNSFKSRLSLYSTKELYEEFYQVCEIACEPVSGDDKAKRIDEFSEKLLKDLTKLKHTGSIIK